MRHVRSLCPPALCNCRLPGDRQTKAQGNHERKPMIEEIKKLAYDELKTLHREIGALLAERKNEVLLRMQEEASLHGFTAVDLVPKKKRNGTAREYQDPDNPENTWSGKGRKPRWLTEALESGRQLS